MTGWWFVVGTVVIALATGAVLKAREGRIRIRQQETSIKPSVELPELVERALHPSTPVTLVQISTTFCAPCRHARIILSALAERTEGLRHVDIDVTNQPEIAQRFKILRTPTTLAFDPQGHELLRINGVPKADTLLEALQEHLPTKADR